MNLTELVRLSLDEDIGPGDISTDSTVAPGRTGTGQVLAKESLIVCGQHVVHEVFRQVAGASSSVRFDTLVEDGERVAAGTIIAKIHAPLAVILNAERVALNFLMRMCGIATHARAFVDAAGPGGPRVVDTRKTTPLHRGLEKYAVRCGGAHNHRFALYDGIMIKDNHIAAVGSIREAVRRARAANHHLVRVQVEVRTLEELGDALATEADAVLLDNMDDHLLAEAVRRARATRPGVILEASGNMTPARIAGLREIGLDVVSAGGLIHQARWCDLSLKIR